MRSARHFGPARRPIPPRRWPGDNPDPAILRELIDLDDLQQPVCWPRGFDRKMAEAVVNADTTLAMVPFVAHQSAQGSSSNEIIGAVPKKKRLTKARNLDDLRANLAKHATRLPAEEATATEEGDQRTHLDASNETNGMHPPDIG